jgi:hypothetical protein
MLIPVKINLINLKTRSQSDVPKIKIDRLKHILEKEIENSTNMNPKNHQNRLPVSVFSPNHLTQLR